MISFFTHELNSFKHVRLIYDKQREGEREREANPTNIVWDACRGYICMMCIHAGLNIAGTRREVSHGVR